MVLFEVADERPVSLHYFRKETHRVKPTFSSSRLTQVLNVCAAILCAAIVVLTIILVVDTDHGSHKAPDEGMPPGICIECARLYKYHPSSTEVWINELKKRTEDGILKCCAETPEQVAAIFGMVSRKRAHRLTESEKSLTFKSVSAHKQLHPPLSEETLTEPVFNEGHNVALSMPNQDDPLIEHVHGVNVTKDSLVIQYPGLYYVYSSVHYKPVSDRPAGEFQYQSWFHYVHRTSTSDHDKTGTLLQTAHSVCHSCTRNEETAFTGGNFYLEAGDVIQVCFSSLGLVHFNRESTFVGVMMLDGVSSDHLPHG